MKRRRSVAPKIEPYDASSAANTIARAREHLANPKMMAAIRTHLAGLNAAVSGPLKPKKPVAR